MPIVGIRQWIPQLPFLPNLSECIILFFISFVFFVFFYSQRWQTKTLRTAVFFLFISWPVCILFLYTISCIDHFKDETQNETFCTWLGPSFWHRVNWIESNELRCRCYKFSPCLWCCILDEIKNSWWGRLGPQNRSSVNVFLLF